MSQTNIHEVFPYLRVHDATAAIEFYKQAFGAAEAFRSAVRDNDGHTPLHYPSRDTRHGEEIIELFIKHGADINAQTNEGRTPVDQMLQNGRKDLAEVLRQHGGEST